MYILGINMSHDRSACLLRDGRILVAIAEERLDRDKRSVGYMLRGGKRMIPVRAITYCLEAQNLGIDELDLIVIDNAWAPVDVGYFREVIPIKDKTKIRALPHPSHHLAHAYSSYFCSPFKESAILIADVTGSELLRGKEGESGFYAKGNEINPVFKTYHLAKPGTPRNKVYFSLTYIYRFITLALGFKLPGENLSMDVILDEAGKTMALAAYGQHDSNWPAIVENAGGVIKTKRFEQWALSCRIARKTDGRLIAVKRGNAGRINQFERKLAYKAQEELVQGLIFLANKLYSATKSDNLCIAGGAGLNCAANKRILENTPFKKIFIQPAATDDGNALGCAMYGWHKIAGGKKRFHLHNAYLGRSYSAKEIALALASLDISLKPLNSKELIQRTARNIAEGKILGWFQGGSEFGPRALGHRSILADPRRPGMKKLLNEKVKHRESFQPYAASVLAEFADEYFHIACPSPFMLLVSEVKKEKRKEIPAVVHVDRTTRIQTVTSEGNGIFYDLIKEFHRISGVPMLLNTSFNMRGEPIIETPDDALKVFFATGMDVLVIGNHVLEKESREVKEGIVKLRKSARIFNIMQNILKQEKQ